MATPLIRFEIILPSVDTGSNDDTAITNFRHSMEAITPRLFFTTAYKFDVSDNLTERSILYGYIPNTTQAQSSALNALNTLNTALSTGAVDCEIWNVTSEP